MFLILVRILEFLELRFLTNQTAQVIEYVCRRQSLLSDSLPMICDLFDRRDIDYTMTVLIL